MGVFSRFEGGLDNAVDKVSGTAFKAPIEPAQVAKAAQKQMLANKLVGTGRLYAPTLYTVLVNKTDDGHLFGFYPTMAAEIETYLMSRGADADLEFDGRPLVRFLVDEKLKRGKFDIIAEVVSAPIIEQLREEEREFYGIKPEPQAPALASVLPTNAPPASAPPVPPPPATAPLLVDTTLGTVHQLTKSPTVIGRDSASDIKIDDANASRSHAQIASDADGVWYVEDLNSTNGTLLNGEPVDKAYLRSDDKITIGVTVLEFNQ